MHLSEWHRWWKHEGARGLRDVLLRAWDPIGVGDVPECVSEYDPYLGPIATRLRNGASARELTDLLSRYRQDEMGLPEDIPADAAAATEIVEWYERAQAQPAALSDRTE